MKKLLYLFIFSFGLTCIMQAAQIQVTQQHEISDAEQRAFESMMSVMRDSSLSEETRYKKVAALIQQYPQIVIMSTAEGYTALIWAAFNDRTEILKLLIAAGADLNAHDTDGWTALIWSPRYGRTESVKLLLAAGANVNAHNTDGWTALMRAAWNGDTKIAKLLIAAGADPNIQNDKDGNKIARDYACDKDAYDTAVQEGLGIKAQYEKNQAAAKNIIAQEVIHIAPLVDMISGYAYDPHNPDDLLETQEEIKENMATKEKCGYAYDPQNPDNLPETQHELKEEDKEKSENSLVKTVASSKNRWCVVQ